MTRSAVRSLLRHCTLSACLVLALFTAVPGQAQTPAQERMLVISAQAWMSYLVDPNGTPLALDSNRVEAMAPATGASLAFFSNDRYTDPAWTTRLGQPMFPRVVASACNQDPLRADTLAVRLSTARSSQQVDAVAVETAANTGVFVLQAPMVNRGWTASAPAASGALDVMPGDVIQATAPACNGQMLAAQLRLESRAVVFEAATGQPIAGAHVRLIDVTGEGNGGDAGGAAAVFAHDGVTPMPADAMTDGEGGYSFPFLRASTYRLLVLPMSSHKYPSARRADRSGAGMASAYPVHASASYGGTFTVSATTENEIVNLPMDALPRGLHVQAMASRTTVEVAETLEYAVAVKNVGVVTLNDVRVQETLPVGFRYEPGSARLDGQALADPAASAGARLSWHVGTPLAADAERTLRYRVRVGTGALQGDGVNRVQAFAQAPDAVISNEARVKVKVEAGVFSDRALVMGTVYADCNANGVKDAGEPGVPGVRLWLEDGTAVTTDGAGRYSVYGLSPRTHVLKLDGVTLPAGATPLATSQRHAGDGHSRFVDPRAGELQRADFALGGCGDAMTAQLTVRRQAAQTLADEGARSLRTALTITAAATPDLRALAASGRIGDATPAGVASTATPAAAALPVEDAAEHRTSLPRFVGVRDGQLMAAADATVRVIGRLGAVLSLRVNGEPVGDDRVGEKAQSADDQTEARTYVGLPLRAGENRLVLQEHDAFGRLRATSELTLRQAGALARIVIDAPARADAGTTVPVRLRLEDAQGLPVDARLPVTLDSASGRWNTPDLDPRAHGVQAFVEAGFADLTWTAPDVPGEARLQVASDGVAAEAKLALVAALRPLMAVGVVDAAFNLRRLKAGQVQAAGSADGFEQQLRAFAGGSSSDNNNAARAAVFLKGKVRGDALLTVAYDSDKNTRERLFRDIQPDAFYPVYGDSSERGFDAQSTGKLYVRIDRGQSSLLYGDFTTQADDRERQLGVYQRSLNGLKQHFQVDGFSANVWAARDTTRQQITELRADGTSGPFTLGAGMAVNSEKVEIVVRDRHQPALVVRTTPQQRFADYEIDPVTGRLLLRTPMPSVDADLNPVFIRVTYEVEQGGSAFWVAGADALWQASEALAVGGALVRDWNPLATMQMGSMNARYQVADRTVLSAEVAKIKRGDTAEVAAHDGGAQRVALTHDGKDFKARVHAARSDVGFDNRAAQINGGRAEAGAQGTYMLDARTRVSGEALHSADLASAARRVGVLVGVERSLEGGTKVEVGARHVQQHGQAPGAGAQDATTTVRARASTTLPGLPTATVFVEGEQDVRDASKRLLAVGGDYQLAGRGRLYARHEVISSLIGPYALDATQRRNTTVVGLDMGAGLGGGEGRVFSEYRGREAFAGRETEAAVGLRNQWLVTPGLRVNGSLERVQALAGAKGEGKGENQSAAVTGAVEYTADPRWKGSARLELRESAGGVGLLSTFGLAVKLDEQWTLLVKNVLAGNLARGNAANRWQERLQLGAAYRDSANQLNALGRYEYKDERGGLTDAHARRAHIVSLHAERQFGGDMNLSGRVAAKQLTEQVAGVQTRSVAQLASVRFTKDVAERWDVGLNVSVMGDGRLRSRQTSFGGELGYRVKDNMWASVGYNLRGFKDRDLTGDNATERGVYVRLRFKFDERALSRLAS
ncbi:SdrD B-like domain-containing protein [Roseateles sp. DC23W]|uniref:SdrD B-like domain-containing protein n=1 Tax=Pelomonas dachongensis TaxID=3299029 RepID=A0ABW7ESC7_9BURK